MESSPLCSPLLRHFVYLRSPLESFTQGASPLYTRRAESGVSEKFLVKKGTYFFWVPAFLCREEKRKNHTFLGNKAEQQVGTVSIYTCRVF